MSTVRSSLTFAKKLAFLALLLLALCAPARAESGNFGGYNDNGATKDEATWTLNGGALTISGGRFTGSQFESVFSGYKEKITSVTFNKNTKLVGEYSGGSIIGFVGWTSLRAANLSGLDTSSLGRLTSFSFSGCTSLTSVTLGGKFDTSKMTSMSDMFNQCTSLKSTDFLKNLDTSSVKNMDRMFSWCTSLETLDLSNFDTSNVTSMYWTFGKCDNLKLLNLSGWDTSNVDEMERMFSSCGNLKTILVGDGWNTSNVTNGTAMFYDDYALVGEKGTKYAWNNPGDEEYARIDDPDNGKPGYLSRSTTVESHYFGGWWDAEHSTWRDQAHWVLLKDGTLNITGGQFTGQQWRDYLKTTEGSQMQGAVYVDFHGPVLLVPETGNNSVSCASMFSGWKKLKIAALNELDTSSFGPLTDTSNMFYDCSALQTVDFGPAFKTSNVTNMKGMFYNCYSLKTLDVSQFDTSSVKNMKDMFTLCSGLTSLDVSQFDTSNVTDMSFMFSYCRGLATLDLGQFNTKNVTDMSHMFSFCSKLTTILVGENWDTAKVTNGTKMFQNDYALVGEGGTEYKKGNDGLKYAHIDGGENNPGYLSTEGNRFGGYLDSSGEMVNQAHWRITDGKLLIYGGQFSLAQWTAYVSGEGKEMKEATSVSFSGTALAPETGKKETSVSKMFQLWKKLQTADMKGLDTTSLGTLVDTSEMFRDCFALTKVRFGGAFKTSKVKNMSGMFYFCHHLKSLTNLNSLNTSSVTDMSYMFYSCMNLKTLSLSKFNTKKVTNMSRMFEFCSSLTALDLTMFDTTNVTNMYRMFDSCSSLTELHLGSWDTGYVENMSCMFAECGKLKTIRVGYLWTTANVTNSFLMFVANNSLVGGRGTKYDVLHSEKEYARIDDPGALLPGYMTGPSIYSIEGTSFQPESVELTEEKVSQVRSAIGSQLPDGVDVLSVDIFTLSDDDVVEVDSALRDIDALSDTDKMVLSNDNRAPAAILPEITVIWPGVLCFVTSLDVNVSTDAALAWYPFPQDEAENSSAEAAQLAADGAAKAVFMKNGTVITTVPADHEVEVAAYLEPGTYAPVIATPNNGSAGSGGSGGGGGCDAGLGALALAAALPLLMRKKG